MIKVNEKTIIEINEEKRAINHGDIDIYLYVDFDEEIDDMIKVAAGANKNEILIEEFENIYKMQKIDFIRFMLAFKDDKELTLEDFEATFLGTISQDI